MKVTASRQRRHQSLEPKGQGVVLPAHHPSARGERSLFPSRVFEPDEVDRVLKSGHNSRKIGAVVTKGHLQGAPIYTLTLEERASCPRTCPERLRCYGNNMQAAERIEHGPDLEHALLVEITQLAEKHPAGFLVRLHVLGDFYSVEYVELWTKLLRKFPPLHIFGFTAHAPWSAIGKAVALLAADHGWRRAAVRFSAMPHEARASRVLAVGETDATATPCPAQNGATDCCATCSLCWESEKSISFKVH